MEECINTFSLLVRGFLLGYKGRGFALTGTWCGAKTGLSISGAHEVPAQGAADGQAASGFLQSSLCTGTEASDGASSLCGPAHSWECRTPSKARSMAAVSSFLHLRSFSDIFLKATVPLIM
ncbi:hypothetical protein I79_006663 [Cricetulus griseus]|uniref:Uncharacterized protein n=1 Tax=Cricetulus griseus TaxID=10029 RepID=G3H8G2_CRIGR|nr:hypothetical protein I79_006663 [Cricetulus griseus]